MPEEKDGAFFDLPDEKEAEQPKEGEQSPEDKQKQEEEIRKLKIANKKEDQRLQKLKEELSEKRKVRKELQGKEDDDLLEEEEEPKEDPIKKTVEAAFKEREEQSKKQALIIKIRERAKTRQEAERILEEAQKFPSDWEVEDVVGFAIQRVQSQKEKNRSFVPPSITGGSVFEDMQTKITDEDLEGFSPERIEWFKQMGFGKEEIKKYRGGMDLSRVFTRTAVNNRPQF